MSDNDQLQDKNLYNIYKELIEKDMLVKKNIYIDFRVVKHFILGYIFINHIKNDEQYDKLVSFLKSDTYKSRITDIPSFSLSSILPNINETISDIYESLNTIDILRYRHIIPNTQHIGFIINLIDTIRNNITILESSTKSLNITFNIFPFSCSNYSLLERILFAHFEIPCKVKYIEPNKLSSYIDEFDLMILYDIEDILQTKYLDNYDNESKLLELNEKIILSTKITNKISILESKSIEEIKKDFQFVLLYLNSLFNFGYLDPINLIP